MDISLRFHKISETTQHVKITDLYLSEMKLKLSDGTRLQTWLFMFCLTPRSLVAQGSTRLRTGITSLLISCNAIQRC